MKRISKQLITTSLAAALIIGGGAALLRTTAYADNSTSSTSSTATTSTTDGTQSSAKDGRGFGHGGMRMGGPRIADETATLLGTDVQTVMTELQAGKTLADIAKEKAGWDEQTLLDKLTAAISTKLDEQVTSGKLTQTQADDQKAKLADSLKTAVETKGLPFDGKGGRGGHGGPGGFGDPAQLKDIATILNLSEADLRTKLQSGQSLAAIAQAQGVSEDDLISKIKDSMTDRIKQFVESVHTAPANGQPPTAAPSGSQAPAAPAASADGQA
jgi:hypothetical protein